MWSGCEKEDITPRKGSSVAAAEGWGLKSSAGELLLELLDLCEEVAVGLHALFYTLAGVDDGGVVAPSDGHTYLGGAQVRVLLNEVHGYLACGDDGCLAVLGEDLFGINLEEGTGLVENLARCEFLLAGGAAADGVGKHPFGELDIHFAVPYDRESHEGVDHALEVAHGEVDVACDVVDDVVGESQAVLADLAPKDVGAQLLVGSFQLGQQPPLESREQSLFHAVERHRWAIGGEDELAAVLVEVVEDMEECLLGSFHAGELLHVVDDEDVDTLVEGNEIVDAIFAHAISILHLEEVCRDIEYAFLGVEFLQAVADGVDEVRLADAGASEDKQGVERHLLGVLGDGEAYGASELVGVSFDKVLERIVWIQLRIQLLEHLGSCVRGAVGVGVVGGGSSLRALDNHIAAVRRVSVYIIK